MQQVTVNVRTKCVHCGKPMELRIDDSLHVEVSDAGCDPVVFIPDVDLLNLDDDSIINAF